MLLIGYSVICPIRLAGQDHPSRVSEDELPHHGSEGDRPLYDRPDTSSISAARLAIVGGTMVATIAAIYIYQMNGWWKNNQAPFHFREDLKYALHVDKIGHFHGASFGTFLLGKSLEWANFSESRALLYGAFGSLLFQTYIEVQDGLTVWGFDRVDFAADVAGAFFPLAQHHVAFLRNVDMKFSYRPSQNLNAPGFVSGQKHLIFDDYEGQTFWLSFKINNLLPKNLEPYWPDFLSVDIGYGARNIVGPQPYRVYLVGLGLDMTRIIPADTWFLKTLGQALNYVRFPGPAVRISPNVAWYGMYF